MNLEERYKKLADTEVIQFIEENIHTPVTSLVLRGSPFESLDINFLVNQIVGKKKAKKKLPTWYKNPKIIYPPKVNLEQTSSEITALHKAKITEGNTLIDLTGGFGIDDYYFSKKIDKITYIEINSELFKIAKFNFKTLSANNIQCINWDSLEYLKDTNHKYNWIYIDPSRRNENQKVFLLKDSLPNVLKNKLLFENKSQNLMIKTSPMYDIEMGYKELSGIKELHIISIKNDVKELLWIIDWREVNSRVIKMYNYDSGKRYSYSTLDKGLNHNDISLNNCQKYLYEFNSSVMKSGLYDSMASKYKLSKIEKNTNFYTSNSKINSFPGKTYIVKNNESINFKKLKRNYKGKYINIICKNIKITTSKIQNKLNCKIGGDKDYLIFSKTIEGNRVIEASKL
ncbi:MAG: SAM-dependent methyltransferase [Psychroflexus sp.]